MTDDPLQQSGAGGPPATPPADTPPTRRGKIARLPRTIRDELNQRLMDGEGGGQLLAWLNALPQTRATIQTYFGGDAISPQNLSEWRKGGYADWCRDHDRVEKIRVLGEYAARLAEASGGSLSDGSAAIAAGRILSVIESASDSDLAELIPALTALRATDVSARRARTEEAKLAQKDRELRLSEKKFDLSVAKEVLQRWLADEQARAIMGSQASHEDKIAQLLAHMEAQEREDVP